ncbi:RNA 2',3'-cyclic phosphodiesterase [Bacillus sp. 1P10SD]|uniref:RNA 2',3'-cyclic phosphodiesterase n=1 Tax=Bacillus sp. 1P10SD TaxID=3132265 RepID=UPI0039A4CFFA
MDQKTHFFFAVRMPEETKLMMKEHIEKIKAVIPFSRWVHFQDLHITLAFLGAASPKKVEIAVSNVREALNTAKPFPLKINRLGFFGSSQSPRVFWADTEESNDLNLLRNKVFSACEEAGFELETRPFRPHITLARKWIGEEAFQQTLLEIWKELQAEPLAFQANEVVLYQTHLHKTPKYEAIQVFRLTE